MIVISPRQTARILFPTLNSAGMIIRPLSFLGYNTDLENYEIGFNKPSIVVRNGDAWKIEDHYLICCKIKTKEWEPYLQYVKQFIPYPDIFSIIGPKKDSSLLVQPNQIICGYILDICIEHFGMENVNKIETYGKNSNNR